MAKSTIKAADLEHRRKINFNIGKYNATVPLGKAQFTDVHLARERAKNVKWRAIENLDKNLEQFEALLTKRGGKVIWAEDAKQAVEEILKICKAKNCKTVVKSKSMVTEEIHLNDHLEEHGIESVETDLGEYIQQLDGEPPYHIVTPAMHKSKEDVAQLFTEKLGTPPNLTPEQLTQVARENLRQKYLQAEIGITGANFIIADIGAVAVSVEKQRAVPVIGDDDEAGRSLDGERLDRLRRGAPWTKHREQQERDGEHAPGGERGARRPAGQFDHRVGSQSVPTHVPPPHAASLRHLVPASGPLPASHVPPPGYSIRSDASHVPLQVFEIVPLGCRKL